MSINYNSVVITGIGVVSPIGIGVQEFWEGLLQGVCGFDRITRYDPSQYSVKIAAEIKLWEKRRTEFLSKREIQCLSLNTQYAVAAAKMAIKDSGMSPDQVKESDVIIGAGAEPHMEIYETIKRNIDSGNVWDSEEGGDPLSALKTMLFGPAAGVALALKTKRMVTGVSSACTSAFHSVGMAGQRISAGAAERIVAGGAEAAIDPILMVSMTKANMLAAGDDPRCVKPLDKLRTRSNMGEGAAIFVLETMKSANNRNARIYARLRDFSQGQENLSPLFTSDKTGTRWAEIIEPCAKNIETINAHAPGHDTIDAIEMKAINKAGIDVRNSLISSNKGSFGSGMASAGAFQIAAAALSVFYKKVPPTVNFKTYDPEIQVRPNERTESLKGQAVLVNAKALGGSEACIVVEAV